MTKNAFVASLALALTAGTAGSQTVPTEPPAPAVPAAAAPASTAPTRAAPTSVAPAASYTPHRVYDTKRRRFVDLETMILDVATRADVAYLGEFHNDVGTHRLQLAVLEGLARRRSDTLVLSLEMFERDVQPQLDGYLGGSIDESSFLAASRPWGNYAADYRPLVELAKARGWPVIASNVPRRLAQVVARRGLVAVDSLPEADRAFIAAENRCPRDRYWERFRETMGDMSGHGMQLSPEQLEQMVWRTYEAQCVKDETMAEAIAAVRSARNTLVVHANGAFHSDYRLGTVERVQRRLPRSRQLVITFTPVADLDAADGRSRRRMGDYVVFTLAPAPTP